MGPTQGNLCRHLFICGKNVINMLKEVFLHSVQMQTWFNPGEFVCVCVCVCVVVGGGGNLPM